MPGGWDPTIYRVRAEDWQDKADALPAGKERDACIALAEGYARLAQLIEESTVSSHHDPMSSP
jgi:hypothetical protein